MEADPFQVGNGLERAEESDQGAIAQRQGVAAAEDDLRNGWVLGDVGDFVVKTFFLSFVGKILSKTVAAVHGTGARRHHQGPPLVLVENFLCFFKPLILDGIGDKTRSDGQLLFQGHKLAQNGIVQCVLGYFCGEPFGEIEDKAGLLQNTLLQCI